MQSSVQFVAISLVPLYITQVADALTNFYTYKNYLIILSHIIHILSLYILKTPTIILQRSATTRRRFLQFHIVKKL